MAGPRITIDGAITFDGNGDVLLERAARMLLPERLHELVELAFEYCNEPALVAAACGGNGPLAQFQSLTFEEFLVLVGQI